MASDGVKTLKVTFPPLYVTAGTKFEKFNGSLVEGGEAYVTAGSYAGHVVGGSGWQSNASTLAIVGTNANVDLALFNTQEVDLMGLFAQGISLAPIGASTQRTEPPAMGSRSIENNYVREFVIWTTMPLDEIDVNAMIASFSPTPPYGGNSNFNGSMTTAQVIAGYSKTYANSSTIDPLVGFLVEIGQGELGFMDMISAPKIYCTRLILFNGQLANNAGRFCDVPFSCEVLGVVQTEPDELTQFTQMARSLDPPTIE